MAKSSGGGGRNVASVNLTRKFREPLRAGTRVTNANQLWPGEIVKVGGRKYIRESAYGISFEATQLISNQPTGKPILINTEKNEVTAVGKNWYSRREQRKS